MSDLSLSIDECAEWALEFIPINFQARYLTDIYKKNKIINNPKRLIKILNPNKIMFIDVDLYYEYIDMVQNIYNLAGLKWKSKWMTRETYTIHEWLDYYLNPKVLTKKNIASMPQSVCAIILGQLKKWYTGDENVHACCLIEYIDQIHLLLLHSSEPEFIEIFNSLTSSYEESKIEDCEMCKPKGRKKKREERLKNKVELNNSEDDLHLSI